MKSIEFEFGVWSVMLNKNCNCNTLVIHLNRQGTKAYASLWGIYIRIKKRGNNKQWLGHTPDQPTNKLSADNFRFATLYDRHLSIESRLKYFRRWWVPFARRFSTRPVLTSAIKYVLFLNAETTVYILSTQLLSSLSTLWKFLYSTKIPGRKCIVSAAGLSILFLASLRITSFLILGKASNLSHPKVLQRLV